MIDEENDPGFDATIGRLDFVLSKMMAYRARAVEGGLSPANRQTLKHHAEDMIAVGNAILATMRGLP